MNETRKTEYGVAVTLYFKTQEEAAWFMGQLYDGFGEGFVAVDTAETEPSNLSQEEAVVWLEEQSEYVVDVIEELDMEDWGDG